MPSIIDCDIAALCGESESDGSTDAHAAAGDNGVFPFQTQIHGVFLFFLELNLYTQSKAARALRLRATTDSGGRSGFCFFLCRAFAYFNDIRIIGQMVGFVFHHAVDVFFVVLLDVACDDFKRRSQFITLERQFLIDDDRLLYMLEFHILMAVDLVQTA